MTLNIYFQISLSWTTAITNWALVWVQVIMNWFRMLFQITFCITNIITNRALILSFVLMNWFHIFKLAFWEKLELQIEHLNDFLLSWLLQYVFLSYLFWEQLKSQIEHFCNLLILYALTNHIFKNKFKYKLSTCMTFCSHWFKMYFPGSFWEKLKLQIGPLYDFFFSWSDPKCIPKLTFLRTAEITNWTLLLVIMDWFSIQYTFSNHIFENKHNHKLRFYMTFCTHELNQNVFSSWLFEKN